MENNKDLEIFSEPLCLRGEKAFPYFASGLTSGFASNFLRMRRSSIKFSAVIVHNTDANMIMTPVSIGAGSFPRSPTVSRTEAKLHPLLRRHGTQGVSVVTGDGLSSAR